MSKAGVSGAADKALLKQFSGYPDAIGMPAAVMIVMAMLPGLPMIPFLALGGGAGDGLRAAQARQEGRGRGGRAGDDGGAAAVPHRPRSRSRPH